MSGTVTLPALFTRGRQSPAITRQRSPEESARVAWIFREHFKKGIAAAGRHNAKVATEHFQQAMSLLPKNADPMYRSVLEHCLGDVQQAEARAASRLKGGLRNSVRDTAP